MSSRERSGEGVKQSIWGAAAALALVPTALLTTRSETLLEEVLVYLRNALRREFSRHVKIVRQPGDNVVRYRAAITGVTTEGGIGSSASNVLPAMFVLRTVSGRNDVRARLFMESEYSDSLTGIPVAAVMQSAMGGAVSGNSGGFGQASGAPQIELSHLKGVLDDWARKAGQILGETVK